MFLSSATLHSAESAITKISPWKVQQFADEEGSKSPFATLSRNLTKLLSTILLTTTASSIYSTALFVTSTTRLFPSLSLGTITALLTVITLLLGEVFPKALALSNSELVARKLVPSISALASLLSPVTMAMTWISQGLLTLTGLRNEEDRNVSEDMLRLVVEEAQNSETGIERSEGTMIKNVLDMQDKEVGKIMTPRVEMVALSTEASALDILETAATTKYSRIPIYREDIDHIVGVVFSKDLLDLVHSRDLKAKLNDDTKQSFGLGLDHNIPSWLHVSATLLMKSPYFIPETMSAYNALQEMRKRRQHLAVVVDEYGGTAGVVTLEDIIEEVVGEIYDEDDEEEEFDDSKTMFMTPDGVYQIKGSAELDVVSEALGWSTEPVDESEHSTISGYLCAAAGRIPRPGDKIQLNDYLFTIQEVEENRRIVNLTAIRIDTNNSSVSESNNITNESSNEATSRVNSDVDR